MTNLKIQCKKCRKNLFDSPPSVYNVHNVKVDFIRQSNTNNCDLVNDALYFEESSLPVWMRDKIDQASWLRGKLHCPKCSYRLGSFDFVTGQRCPCSQFVVPPVHLVKSKVDYVFDFNTLGGLPALQSTNGEISETELPEINSELSIPPTCVETPVQV